VGVPSSADAQRPAASESASKVTAEVVQSKPAPVGEPAAELLSRRSASHTHDSRATDHRGGSNPVPGSSCFSRGLLVAYLPADQYLNLEGVNRVFEAKIWLVAERDGDGVYHPLKSVKWGFKYGGARAITL
jgi:hypothetical protein